MTLMSAIKTIMSAIKTIISVSPNWRKVLKQFRQTEVRCAIGASAPLAQVAIDSASLGYKNIIMRFSSGVVFVKKQPK